MMYEKNHSDVYLAPRQMMRALILVSSLLAGLTAGPALLAQSMPSTDAAVAPRIVQLEKMLNRVNQEQQSVYQQFQMVQELRRNEIQESNPLVMQGPAFMGGVKNAPPINYDDNVQLQQQREARIRKYADDLNRLYARYSELSEQKKSLTDELMTHSRDSAQ